MAVAAAEPSQEEKAKLATQVKGIFEKKCAKCHGPKGVRETEKAKGDFDFVLDLEKLASDPDKIVRGNVDESMLLNMVEDELMPDENSQDPLPDHEKNHPPLDSCGSSHGRREASRYGLSLSRHAEIPGPDRLHSRAAQAKAILYAPQ